MVAVLFLDYDELMSSRVWYRQLDSADLSTVSSQVSAAYHDQAAFTGTQGLVITWEAMEPFDNPNPTLDPVSPRSSRSRVPLLGFNCNVFVETVILLVSGHAGRTDDKDWVRVCVCVCVGGGGG